MLIASPTPVALSNTSLVGTPPQNSKTAFSPSQTHSEFSPRKHWAKETLENGNVTTRKCTSRTIPRILKSQTPKSTWASAGAHSRCRNSSFARLSSDFLAFTYCCTMV